MKTLNTIKGLLLAAILFGLFANFAHNNYGMYILSVSFALFVFIFPIYSIFARRKKKKLGLKQSESPIFEGIILMLYSIGVVLELNHYSFGNLLILIPSLFLIIYLIILSIKTIVNKNNTIGKKLLSIYYFLVMVLGSMFSILFIFTTLNNAASHSKLLMIFMVLLILAVISIIISIAINGKKSILFNNFKSIFKGNMAILMVVFILLSIYSISAKFNMQLKLYDDITPIAEQKLRNQVASTNDYKQMEKKRIKYSEYSSARYWFFNHREKSKNN